MTRATETLLNWFQFGTGKYPQQTKRRLVITNILVTFLALGSLLFLLIFLMIDPKGLKYPILVMVVCGPLFLLSPFLHRFNAHAASLFNIVVWYFYSLSVAYLLGANTGMHFLFLSGVTSAILVFGIRQNWISIFNIGAQMMFFIYAGKVWVEPSPFVDISASAQNGIYIFMTIWSVGVIFYLISYAFRQAYRAENLLEQEHRYSEQLLQNMMPAAIASRLKRNPEDIIADSYENVTIMFADVVGFTERASARNAEELVSFLNRLFTRFDFLAMGFGLEKIKTTGDEFMVAGGLPELMEDHSAKIADLALALQETVSAYSDEIGEKIELRIGIHSGPVVAGVVGTKKPFYDVWGDTVNMASRLEETGVAGRTCVSRAIRDALADRYELEPRGPVDMKGKGTHDVWFLNGVLGDDTSSA